MTHIAVGESDLTGTKTCLGCKQHLAITSFRERGDRGSYYRDSHCVPCRRLKDNHQRLIRQGRAPSPVVEVDRSYTPITDFLAMGEPERGVALVASVGRFVAWPEYERRVA